MSKPEYGGPEKCARELNVPRNLASDLQIERILSSVTRPFVLINERELSVLRRGLTKDGWKRALYLQPARQFHGTHVGEGLLSVANRWVESPIVIPARGGHYHHFFCHCGARLTIPPNFTVGGNYTCSACGMTFAGENYDGAVRYLHHNHLSGAALACALVYAIEKDRVYSDKAAEILLGYSEAYPGPHTDSTTGGMMLQSLCEAVWVIPLAQAYDLIYYSRSLNEPLREQLEARLLRPIAEGLKSIGIAGNWGSWHLAAVGVLGLAIKAADLVRYALESFQTQLIKEIGSDGLWPESVHTYHFYALTALIQLAEACHRAGIDIYSWEPLPGRSLKTLFTAPLQYVYPSFRLPAINDGWYDAFLPLDLYEIAHRRWDDPTFAWVLKRGYRFGEAPINADQREHVRDLQRRSYFAFLFGRDLPGRSSPPVMKSHDFHHIGICTLRRDDEIMVTFDYGPFYGHGHLDKLSFTLYARDTLLLPDYGTPGYGSSALSYYSSTFSHNTVVVDGRSQEAARRHGLKNRFCGKYVQFADATADDCYPGVTHARRIALVAGHLLIYDRLTSQEEHDYDWLIHCEGEPSVCAGIEMADASLGHETPVLWTRHYAVPESFEMEWRCGKVRLALGAWGSPEESLVALGEGPAETLERKCSVLAHRRRAADAEFVTVLSPLGENERVDMAQDGPVLRLSEKDCVHYLFVRRSQAAHTEFPILTDGELAAVRCCDGQVQSATLIRGTFLRWMDEVLLEFPEIVDCVEVNYEGRTPTVIFCGRTPGVLKLRASNKAVCVNGRRAIVSCSNGIACLQITPENMAEVEAHRQA